MSRSQWPDSTNSPSEIPGTIHDYLVFWMSALGMVNVMALGGAVACYVTRIPRRAGLAIPARVGPPTASAFLLLVFLFGATCLARDYQRTLIGEGRFPYRREAVRLLFLDIEERMRTQGYNTSRIQIAPPVRVVAAGVVLQLSKLNIPVAVADPWVSTFTEALRSTGREDVVFRFVGPKLNDELRNQSDYLLIGRYRNVSVYEQLR